MDCFEDILKYQNNNTNDCVKTVLMVDKKNVHFTFLEQFSFINSIFLFSVKKVIYCFLMLSKYEKMSSE